MANGVSYQISGDNTGFLKAWAECKAAVTEGHEQITGAVEGINGAFEKITKTVGVFTAALAGGAAFKEIIEKTVELTTESILLGRQLGISATEASVLKVALEDVFVTQEQLSAASTAVTRTLRSHEDAFRSLGVATRDQNGNYRNTLDIILDVNSKLAELKEGTDRNVEGQRIYAKSWSEVAPIINLTREAMEEAQTRAEALGLEIGTKDVEANIRYRKAVNESKDVTLAATKAIGDQLLPELAAMGEQMSAMGSGIVTVFKYVGAAILTVIEALREGSEVIFESIRMVVEGAWALFSGFANAVARLLVFDFSGAKTAWKHGWDELGRIGEESMNRMVTSAQTAHDRIINAFAAAAGAPDVGNAPIPRAEGGGSAPAADPKTSRFSGWEATLAEQKAAFQEQEREEGSFHEYSKSQELAYWQNILATVKTSDNERIQLRKQIAGLELSIDKERFQAELAGLQAQEAQYKNNVDARLAIARDYAERVKAAYGEDSKQYAEASKQIIEIERQKQEQLKQIKQQQLAVDQARGLAEIDQAQADAELMTELFRQTQAQLLEEERAFEEQRYSIRLQALEQQLALAKADPDRNPAEVARLYAQIEQLTLQHSAKLHQIHAATIKEQQKGWTTLFRTMQSGFERVISDFLHGSRTFAGMIRGLFQAVGDAILELIARQAAQWLAVQIEQLIFGKTAAASTVATQAAIAGASGVASFAGAPWPIDIGAPAFGAAMAGLAGAYAGLIAAEGGYDVPAGLSPITQLHPEEMVLPKDLAQSVRDMTGAGGGRGGGSSTDVNFIPVGKKHGLVTRKDMVKLMRKAHSRFSFS
jgi:hypothetical protein